MTKKIKAQLSWKSFDKTKLRFKERKYLSTINIENLNSYAISYCKFLQKMRGNRNHIWVFKSAKEKFKPLGVDFINPFTLYPKLLHFAPNF